MKRFLIFPNENSKMEYASCFSLVLVLLTVSGVTTESDGYLIDVPGDVSVVGMFEIFHPKDGQCGDVDVTSVMEAEAIKWYLQNLNKQSNANIQIGFRAYHTCRLTGRAEELAARVLNDAVTATEPKIVGVIGPEFSEEMIRTSPILSSVTSENRLAQISFSATSSQLANRIKYPNFFRVIPNDDIQTEVMVLMMKDLEWNRIGVIYENDLYGTTAAEGLRVRAELEGICISQIRAIEVGVSGEINADDIYEILNDFTKKTNPKINGIVVFGTKSTVNLFFLILDNFNIADTPAVIVSEGILLQDDTYTELNGNIISKAKGSYVTSPPKADVMEFQTYLKNIFTNFTALGTEIKTNPWLYEVYKTFKGCIANDLCVNETLTSAELDKYLSSQSLGIHYAVLAAHSMAKAVYDIQTRLCGSAVGNCQNFQLGFKPSLVIDELNFLQINPTTDFSFILSSLTSRYTELSFHNSSELQLPRETPSYGAYNFRGGNNSPLTFSLTQIGTYSESGFNLNKDDIRDYIGTQVLQWPNLRKAGCKTGFKCEECIPENLGNRYLHIPGEFYVVGVVPVHNKGSTNSLEQCGDVRDFNGYDIVEAMRWALNKFNDASGEYSSMFSGKTIGLIVIDSCNDVLSAQAKVLELHRRGLPLETGGYLAVSEHIIGYVGGLGSSVTKGVAQVLTILNHVQVSYASTSSELDDATRYPNLLRIVPADSQQVDAIINIIKSLNGTYIQVIYSQGLYGESASELMRNAAQTHDICVAQEIMVPEDNNYFDYYNKIREKPDAKIVVVFLRSHVAKQVVDTLVNRLERGQFVFIGSEAWARNPFIIQEDINFISLGSVSMEVSMNAPADLLTFIKSLTPVPSSVNPWATVFLETRLNCYFNGSFDQTSGEMCSSLDAFSKDQTFELDTWDITATNSMLSLLIGAWKFFESKCGAGSDMLCLAFKNDRSELRNYIIDNVRLDLLGTELKQKVFKSSVGHGDVGYYINNIQREGSTNLQYQKVGSYSAQGSFTFDKDLIVYPSGRPTPSSCQGDDDTCSCVVSSTTCVCEETQCPIPPETIVLINLAVVCVVLAGFVIIFGVCLYKRKKDDDPGIMQPSIPPRIEPDYMTPIEMEHYERPSAIGCSPSGSMEEYTEIK